MKQMAKAGPHLGRSKDELALHGSFQSSSNTASHETGKIGTPRQGSTRAVLYMLCACRGQHVDTFFTAVVCDTEPSPGTWPALHDVYLRPDLEGFWRSCAADCAHERARSSGQSRKRS